MENLNTFVENWGTWAGVIAAFMIAAERIARVTPTKTDDAILDLIRRVASVLSLNVRDNPGSTPPALPSAKQDTKADKDGSS